MLALSRLVFAGPVKKEKKKRRRCEAISSEEQTIPSKTQTASMNGTGPKQRQNFQMQREAYPIWRMTAETRKSWCQLLHTVPEIDRVQEPGVRRCHSSCRHDSVSRMYPSTPTPTPMGRCPSTPLLAPALHRTPPPFCFFFISHV